MVNSFTHGVQLAIHDRMKTAPISDFFIKGSRASAVVFRELAGLDKIVGEFSSRYLSDDGDLDSVLLVTKLKDEAKDQWIDRVQKILEAHL